MVDPLGTCLDLKVAVNFDEREEHEKAFKVQKIKLIEGLVE
jgi:hypothetical protein